MALSLQVIRHRAKRLRNSLENAFSEETAFPGCKGLLPSTGHCAAVAAVVKLQLGGELVSAMVEKQSHWFNRLKVGHQFIDLDLTGDQFGRPAPQFAPAGSLYKGTRPRNWRDLNEETLHRAQSLAQRAGLQFRYRHFNATSDSTIKRGDKNAGGNSTSLVSATT